MKTKISNWPIYFGRETKKITYYYCTCQWWINSLIINLINRCVCVGSLNLNNFRNLTIKYKWIYMRVLVVMYSNYWQWHELHAYQQAASTGFKVFISFRILTGGAFDKLFIFSNLAFWDALNNIKAQWDKVHTSMKGKKTHTQELDPCL
jgi:hypothetical protein